MIFSAEKNG